MIGDELGAPHSIYRLLKKLPQQFSHKSNGSVRLNRWLLWLMMRVSLADSFNGLRNIQMCFHEHDPAKPMRNKMGKRLGECQQTVLETQITRRYSDSDRPTICNKILCGKLWPRVIFASYVVFTIRVIISTWLQYDYDYHKFHYIRLHEAREEGQTLVLAQYGYGSNINLNLTESKLYDIIQTKVKTLKLFGAPYINCSFVVECLSIFLIILSLFAYLVPIVCFNRKFTFNFYYVREIIDWTKEQKDCLKLICLEIEKLIQSSRNYVDNQMRDGIASTVENEKNYYQQHIKDHEFLVRQLKEMAVNGRLQPANRSSRWLERLVRVHLKVTIIFFMITLQNCITLILFLPSFTGGNIETQLMDIIYLFEVCCLCLIMAISGSLYVPLTFISYIDQCWLVEGLDTMIKKCISKSVPLIDSCLELAHVMQQDNVKSRAANRIFECNRKRINANIIYVLIQWKIFVSQYQSLKSNFALVTFILLIFALSLPAVAHVHIPYTNLSSFRFAMILLSMIHVVMADLCLIPVCYLHQRCSKLYSGLSGLLAILADSRARLQNGLFVANGHTTEMLRKEISNAHEFSHQFAVGKPYLQFTYSTLIKAHFYFGFITLSLMVKFQLNDDQLAQTNIFRDPLRIMSTKHIMQSITELN